MTALLSLCGSADASAPGPQLRGVNMHPFWGSADRTLWRQELDLAARAGVDVVRIDLAWANLEPGPETGFTGPYVERMDEFVNDARAEHLKVVPIVWGTPCWASTAPATIKGDCTDWWSSGADRYPPEDPSRYGRLTGWIADRWGPDLAGVELWNEPNLKAFWRSDKPAADYAELVEAAFPAIEEARPGVPVVIGALSGAPLSFASDLASRLHGQYDALSVHPYGPPNGLRRRLANLKAAITAPNGHAKPIWLTELGFSTCSLPTDECVGRAEQAGEIADSITTAATAPDVGAAMLYGLRDTGADPALPGGNFGLVTNAFDLKPSYGAFRDTLAALRPTSSDESAPSPAARLTISSLALTPRAVDGRAVCAGNSEQSCDAHLAVIVRVAGKKTQLERDLQLRAPLTAGWRIQLPRRIREAMRSRCNGAATLAVSSRTALVGSSSLRERYSRTAHACRATP